MSINTLHFHPLIKKAKDEGVFSRRCKLRRVKYLNNCIENDHKAIKRNPVSPMVPITFYSTIYIDVMEAMRMIQKGQLRYIKKQDICAQKPAH
nr:DDE-type integrase/transposase/recombinase [Piscirickettsia salmonis]